MAHTVQPLHSVWIYRNDTETFLRFTANMANAAGTSTTFYANADGTVSFSPSNAAPTVNYIRNLTADPKVLKRIWTDGTRGHSAVEIAPESAADTPYVNAQAYDSVTNQLSALGVKPAELTLQSTDTVDASTVRVAPTQVQVVSNEVDLSADKVVIAGGTTPNALDLVLGDIKMDIFSPANNAVIIYDLATNTYKALDRFYTRQEIDDLLAGRTSGISVVPFSYAWVPGQLRYPMPTGCIGLLYLTASTGQTVNPLSGWTVDRATGTFTLTAPMPSGVSYMFGQAIKG